MDFTYKSAVVLGGIGGIGKAICLHFMKRGLKSLAIIDVLDETKALTSLGGNFKAIKLIYKQCSVTDEPQLRKCMAQIKDELEGVDIIINSSGILDETQWKNTIDINYGGVVNSTLIGIDLMRKDKGMGGGVIVNIASIAALSTPFSAPIYAGSKHAVLAFTRSLKNDKFFEKIGVKFIAICPGVTDTPLMDFEKFFNRQLFPSMVDEVKSMFSNIRSQNVDVVGACVVAALDDGENGSTWRCENNRIEKLKMFEYPNF